MSPRRPGRPAARPTSVREQHATWLCLVDVTGPFLSVPVLVRAWPSGLDALDRPTVDTLRRAHAEFLDDRAGGRDPWIRWVLSDLLGWNELLRQGPDVPGSLTVDVPEHDETLRPDFVLADPDQSDQADGPGEVRLLGLVLPPGTSPTGRWPGRAWAASPVDRCAHLLRHHRVPLGLVTDGRWWALVAIPTGGITTSAVFDADLWVEERDLARAFVSLLARRRFFAVAEDERLPQLLTASLDAQEEVTEALGIQVRRAVELLVDAMSRADAAARARGGTGLAHVDAHEVYVGAVAVLMRLVFLLFAEERRLLPADDDIYREHYSASHLVDQLRARANLAGEEALEHTTAAWHRLLALFRAVHGGIDHGRLRLPAYGGSLFDPDTHPWLEGRTTPADPPATQVLPVDDRTVLHALESVQYVVIGAERRRLTFGTIDVEQIGYVYEGLLGYDAYRATETIVGLTGSPGREEEVPLSRLERLAGPAADLDGLAATLAETYRTSGIGSARAIARKLTPLTGDAATDGHRRLLAATGGDAAFAERVLAFHGLLRTDLRGLPVIVRPGALYVTESPLRRFTGTHYTPRFLAEQVVEGALQPLCYSPSPLQTADRSQWVLRNPEELLDLRVADIAMGSGAFLVAAARYLAARLVEARTAPARPSPASSEPDEQSTVPLAVDDDSDPVLVEARREVITHCLYGVDINPMAVEMAKLSLWLVSLDRARPFSFLDDRLVCGDSLLGVSRLDQLEAVHLDPGRMCSRVQGRLDWYGGLRDLVAAAAELRRELIAVSVVDLRSVTEKIRLLDRARNTTGRASLVGDLAVGAALAGAKLGPRRIDELSELALELARQLVGGNEAIEQKALEHAQLWLDTDHVQGGFPRSTVHWPLVFPEVFAERSGFDAVIGNPPFLGGQKLTGALGDAYREYLVEVLGRGTRGSADLVAYFFLRAHDLLSPSGQTGLLATNTVAQGDTREVGLDQIVADGVEIRQAIKSERWPSKSAALQYSAVWTTEAPVEPAAQHVCDGLIVSGITSSLDPRSRVEGRPHRLAANAGIAFQGSNILGVGFTMSPEDAAAMIARDSRHRDVLFPYLDGDDLNSRPDCSARRWVIDFFDWPLEDAAEHPEVLDRVRRLVKPERDQNRYSRRAREKWWLYERDRPELRRAIEGLDRVIVIARVSSTLAPAFVARRQVFHEKLVVFAWQTTEWFALLASTFHYWWATMNRTTLGAAADTQYAPRRAFETFPLPQPSEAMHRLGSKLDTHRHQLMLARQAGLTATYNLVHDPGRHDDDIAGLRAIHEQIDHAVAGAYGWTDLDLDHGFHGTPQGDRFTVGPTARQEILDRLLQLNHDRYTEEVANGLHGDRDIRSTARSRRRHGGDATEGLF